MTYADRDRAIPGRPDTANRAENDFYRTPRNAVEALLKVEKFEGVVWEPACGDGAISDVMLEHGLTVYSSDLVDYGYKHAGPTHNFLAKTTGLDFQVNHVVTNPPFKLALEFAKRSLEVADGKVALLCRLLWLSSQKRKAFFEASPLARVWIFSKRINFNRDDDPRFDSGKGGMVDYMFCVWQQGYTGKPEINWF